MEFNNYQLVETKTYTNTELALSALLWTNILTLAYSWFWKHKVVVDGVPTSEYNKLVEDHNDLLREKTELEEKNEKDVSDYNELVEKHNSLIEQLEALQEKNEKDVDDYNKLVEAHNALVEDNTELTEKLEDAEKRIGRLESRISRWF